MRTFIHLDDFEFIREFGNNAFDVGVVEKAAQGDREALELIFKQISKEDRVLSRKAYERSRPRFPIPSPEEMRRRLNQGDLGREDTNQEDSNRGDFPPFLPTPEQETYHPLGNRTSQQWIRYAVLNSEWRKEFKDCFPVDFSNLPRKHPARKHERLLCFVFENDPDTALAARESVFLPLEKKKVNELFAWAKKQRPYTPSTGEYPSTVKRGKPRTFRTKAALTPTTLQAQRERTPFRDVQKQQKKTPLKQHQKEPPCEKKHIFICHAGEDAEIANQLTNDLENRGHETMVDIKHLKLAGDTIDFINQSIENAHTVLILYSKYTARAKWQKLEIKAAFWNEQEQSGGLCIVIRLDGSRIPPILGPRVYGKLDRSSPGAYEKLLEDLCAAVSPQKTASSTASEASRPESTNPTP